LLGIRRTAMPGRRGCGLVWRRGRERVSSPHRAKTAFSGFAEHPLHSRVRSPLGASGHPSLQVSWYTRSCLCVATAARARPAPSRPTRSRSRPVSRQRHPAAGCRDGTQRSHPHGHGALATAPRSAPPPEPWRPMGRLLLLPAVPAIIAPVPAIIAPILAPIPTASHPPHRDRSRAGHRCGPHDRSPSHHSATHTSTSTQHVRLLP
jgi:hypothetical protein